MLLRYNLGQTTLVSPLSMYHLVWSSMHYNYVHVCISILEDVMSIIHYIKFIIIIIYIII